MKIIAIIPARYQSSRFPGKPLALLCGAPMIQWVYEAVSQMKNIDEVYVATDDERIYQTVKNFSGNAIMTSNHHICGSDRLAECAESLGLNDDDIIINIQGDEPLVKPEMIHDLLKAFELPDVYMGTLKKRITDAAQIENPNIVKVVTDISDNAILFSRYAIPYNRDAKMDVIYYKHIGIYAYKKWFLMKYSNMPKTSLEHAESLEQLRVIEHGFKIKVIETAYETIGVDTPDELILAEKLMSQHTKQGR